MSRPIDTALMIDGRLEASHRRSRAGRFDILLVCHPHPLHQGTMHNKVVTTLAVWPGIWACRSCVFFAV